MASVCLHGASTSAATSDTPRQLETGQSADGNDVRSSSSAGSASTSSAASGDDSTAPEAGSPGAAASSDAASSGSSTAVTAESSDAQTPNENALSAIIGEAQTSKLLEQSPTNPDALWIATHVDAFNFGDAAEQAKILRLAADEPAALKFVRELPAKYPMEAADMNPELATSEAGIAGTVFDTGVPHLYQWDRRWGHTVYSSSAFGLSGCGPTCMAIVYQGLTGNTDISPYDMGIRAQELGFMDITEGTDIGLFFNQAETLGLTCEPIDISADAIRNYLGNGYLIVANLGEGYFTQFGHFFVLTRIADDGSIVINDPYSERRSTQTWDANLIANESVALFAFAVAPEPIYYEEPYQEYYGYQGY